MLGVRAICRLSKAAIVSLFETHAHRQEPRRHLTVDGHEAWVALEWRRRQIIARGHSNSKALTIAFEGRAGVAVKDSFNLKLRRPDRSSGATASFSAHPNSVHFPAPNRAKAILALAAALPKIAQVLLWSSKDIATFLRTKDPATAMRLRCAFGITSPDDDACILPRDLLCVRQSAPKPVADVTIVIPVFNAFEDLSQLLPRLKDTNTAILFVNDGSDDPRIAPLLAKFAHQTVNTGVISHAVNQGFVAAANTGFAHAHGHIILLNSDTIVPSGDWVARLLAPMEQDQTVASVTPFSNNAEILSIPNARTTTNIDATLVDQIDRTAKRINPPYASCDVPTGIGFCMALRKEFLSKIGPFDPAFGLGYGEEVDWCQRAQHAGGRNVGLSSVFVGHKGGASFGAQKKARIKAASKIISARFPKYDANVQHWVTDAPVQAQKLALTIAWLSAVATTPTPVFVAHSLGGGAETALQADVAAVLVDHPGVLILRVGGPALWRLEVKGPDFHLRGDASDEDTVQELLAPLSHLHLVYSCGVGGRHPLDALTLLTRLLNTRCTLDINIHDFFPISPSWNLLNAAGQFHSIPDLCTTDPAHCVPALNGHAPISHASWRAHWAKLFDLARQVTVFSESSAQLITAAYPSARTKIVLQPHAMTNMPEPIAPGGQTVGILGSLNQAKGAEVVQRLSQKIGKRRKFIVLGEIDGAFPLKKPSLVHGAYAQADIVALARKYDIGVWFIPSICPETFSFATHEALATGLPVLAFARGAQGDAVHFANNGHVIDADPSDTQAISSAIERAFATAQSPEDKITD